MDLLVFRVSSNLHVYLDEFTDPDCCNVFSDEIGSFFGAALDRERLPKGGH